MALRGKSGYEMKGNMYRLGNKEQSAINKREGVCQRRGMVVVERGKGRIQLVQGLLGKSEPGTDEERRRHLRSELLEDWRGPLKLSPALRPRDTSLSLTPPPPSNYSQCQHFQAHLPLSTQSLPFHSHCQMCPISLRSSILISIRQNRRHISSIKFKKNFINYDSLIRLCTFIL